MWAASGAGRVEVLDVAAGRMQGALAGAAGSVRCLALHPSEPLLASAGLDRFVRVHSSGTRKQLGRTYLKTHITGLAWVPPPLAAPAADEAAGSGAEGQGAAAAGGESGKQRRPKDKRKGGVEGGAEGSKKRKHSKKK